MGSIQFRGVHISGNFAKVTKKKPRSIDRDYKVMVPYFLKWREKIGKVRCNCKELLECYQPWYGKTWYHSDECALMIQIKKKPQLKNLWCYQHLPGLPIDYDLL